MKRSGVKRAPAAKPRAAARTGAAPGAADRPTTADLIVLAALAEKPTHGYDLVNLLVERGCGEPASVSKAQVYYSLKKLLALGFIAAAKDVGPPAGPERERYRPTAAGRRVMASALSQPEWARERPAIPFHAWLQVVAQAEPVARATVLRQRRAYLDEQIDKQQELLATLRGDPAGGDAVRIAVVAHAVEVCRLERELLAAVEPMLR